MGALAVVTLGLAACRADVDGPAPVSADDAVAAQAVRGAAIPLTGSAADHDALLALVGDAQVVLLGESTHGTHEYYRERMRITQRLVQERGFRAVAIEGDWPEVARVNAYVRGTGADASAVEALSGFTRFPRWMWRNTVVRDLAEWMRARNAAQPASGDVGIYGLDVYALGTAIDDVTRWLAATDPAAAQEARSRYACFDATQRDPQRYGGASVRPGGSCAADAAAALALVRARATATPDPVEAEVRFRAEGSAHSVVAAEEYFRALYAGVESSWNLRDRRMDAQLAAVQAHVAAVTGGPGKVVVWAHNSHVGDARHTEQGQQGELNLGQLVRQRLGGDASVLVGFFTHGGTVRAAAQWDAPGQVFTVRPALAGSASALLHAAAAGGPSAFVLPLRGSAAAASAAAALDGPRLERAIGVIYMPERERQSHYFTSNLARRFDALVYVDRTTALEPLP